MLALENTEHRRPHHICSWAGNASPGVTGITVPENSILLQFLQLLTTTKDALWSLLLWVSNFFSKYRTSTSKSEHRSHAHSLTTKQTETSIWGPPHPRFYRERWSVIITETHTVGKYSTHRQIAQVLGWQTIQRYTKEILYNKIKIADVPIVIIYYYLFIIYTYAWCICVCVCVFIFLIVACNGFAYVKIKIRQQSVVFSQGGPRWWYKRLPSFPLPSNTLHAQLHLEHSLWKRSRNWLSDTYILNEW